jgi:hypothetical protein
VRALLAIAARELRERWTLPFAMFVWGFAPLLLVRYVDVTARPLATMAAVAAAWGTALLMGGSVIAGDLASGRLGYFFARPVPWWSIAGGKLLAALVMSIAGPLAGILPTLLLDWNPAKDAQGLGELLTGGGIALMLALLLALIGFGHVAGVVYRARSTWAAVDFVLFGACVWGSIWLFYAFKRLGVVVSGPPASRWLLLPPLLLVAAVPLAAAVVQVAVGRSDLQRGHRALSLTFWAGALAWLAVLGGLLVRERAVTPAALTTRGLAGSAPDGRLVAISGFTGRAAAAFAYDTTSGRSLRLGLGSRPAFAADGRHVAWMEEAPFWRKDRTTEIQLARLDDAGFAVEPVELAARLPQGDAGLALSPKADRVAIVQSQTLSVFELPSGRSLSSSSAADGDWMAAAFLESGELRAFRRVRPALGAPGSGVAPGRVEVVAMKGGVPEGAIPLDAVGHAMLASPPDGGLVLLNELQTPLRYSLHDARTGRRLRTFSGEDGFQVASARLLADGGVAVLEVLVPSKRLRLAHEGRPDRVVSLPATAALLSPGPAEGLLAVACFTFVRGPQAGETLFFSSDTGEPRGREEGLLPALAWHPWQTMRAAPAAQLFVADAGELVRFDPATRARRVLLPAPPPRPLTGGR